jgi:hypothetical protein
MEDQDQREERTGDQQRQNLDAAGVQDGDDQDGADFVNEGQGE